MIVSYPVQVLLEALRLHPPVIGITKDLWKDTVLGGYTVYAGTTVFVSLEYVNFSL